jgi:chromosome partitioning protein
MSPFRLVIANQKGGVGKTTTAVMAARYFNDRGYRVLLVDTDPQGGVGSLLGLKDYGRNLFNFLVSGMRIEECSKEVRPGLDILSGDRQTQQAEGLLGVETMKELAFVNLFPSIEEAYDVILFDVAPSISLFQTCATLYARQILVPLDMDICSVTGAASVLQTCQTLMDTCGKFVPNLVIRAIGLLPVKVDKRYRVTEQTLDDIEMLRDRFNTPILPSIRTDANIGKARRARKFLADYDPKSHAFEDYTNAFDALAKLVKDQLAHAEALSQTA